MMSCECYWGLEDSPVDNPTEVLPAPAELSRPRALDYLNGSGCCLKAMTNECLMTDAEN